MPELPDVVVYIEALERLIVGETLQKIRVVSPSVFRTYDPPLSAVEGRHGRGPASHRKAHRLRHGRRAVRGRST